MWEEIGIIEGIVLMTGLPVRISHPPTFQLFVPLKKPVITSVNKRYGILYEQCSYIFDHYRYRPLELENLCLYELASLYEIESRYSGTNSYSPSPDHPLQNIKFRRLAFRRG